MKITLDLSPEQISAILEQVFKSGLYGVSLTSASLAKSPNSRKNALDGFSKSHILPPVKKLRNTKLKKITVRDVKKVPTAPKHRSRFPKNLVELGVEEYLKSLPINQTFTWGQILSWLQTTQEIACSNGTLADALNFLIRKKILHKPKKGSYTKLLESDSKSSFKSLVKSTDEDVSTDSDLGPI